VDLLENRIHPLQLFSGKRAIRVVRGIKVGHHAFKP
jgi:hypothetical protein